MRHVRYAPSVKIRVAATSFVTRPPWASNVGSSDSSATASTPAGGPLQTHAHRPTTSASRNGKTTMIARDRPISASPSLPGVWNSNPGSPVPLDRVVLEKCLRVRVE